MTTFVSKAGNLLDSQTDVLVNPVNLVGVMGAGLARQFKQRFPANYTSYRQWCRAGAPTTLYITRVTLGGIYIVNLPTKRHWRDAADLSLIDAGLGALPGALTSVWVDLPCTVAVPMLGCGLGGLRWADVRPVVVERLSGIDGLTVFLYEVER